MITKLAALTLLPMLLVGGAVMNASVVVVDVQDSDGTHIVVPVPLALAQLGLAFAPDEVKYVQIHEASRYMPYAQRIVQELSDAPDGVFVEVQDGDDHVIVAKEGGALRVSVDEGDGASVRVNVPFESIMAIMDAYDPQQGIFRTSRLVGALRTVPSGDLVSVIDGNDRVRIRVW